MAGRRGNKEGGITKRYNRDGKLVGYQVRILMHDGKRKTMGTAATWDEALKLAQKAQVDLSAGRLSASPRQTLADFLDGWLAARRDTVRYKTIQSYKRNAELAKRSMGHVKLDALRPAHIVQWQADLSKSGLSLRSVQQAHVVLHTALEYAVQVDLIGRNPLDRVKAPKPTHKEMKTLSLEQVLSLFEATEGQRLHALWVTLATTGLRINEALPLKWDDIDLEKRTLTIRRGLERQKGVGLVFTDLKSRTSRRSVEITAEAVDALAKHRTRQKAQRLLVGPMWQEQGIVFASPIGSSDVV